MKKPKPSFLNQTRPLLTAVVLAETPDDMICIIENSLYDGAEAFCIQMETLRREFRDLETIKRIFSYCEDKPIYVTSYRNAQSTGMTDDECVEYLMLCVEAGATLADILADLYDPLPHQITFDETAVAKQKEVVKKLHEMGAEVLLSSHLHGFYESDDILRFAKAQIERGADVAKLVTHAQTREQLMEDILIAERLNNELDAPYLFLANGPHSKLLRQIGCAFGVCMILCVQHYDHINSKEQPKLTAAKAIRDAMCL